MAPIRLGGWLVACLVGVLSWLGCEGPRSASNMERSEASLSLGLETDSTPWGGSLGGVSTRDRETILEALAAREYWASEQGELVQAPNRRHDLRSHFEPTGVRVFARTGTIESALVELELARIGRGGHLVPVGPGVVRHEQARVEIDREELSLVEWFENSPEGLEQGFTLAERPATRGRSQQDAPVFLELAVSSAEASLLGDSILLATESGRKLSYGHLVTRDATGRELASHFEVPSSDRVRLVVEDVEAVYPIVIDPLLQETADTVLQTNVSNGYAAVLSIASAGDTNGDGLNDLIVRGVGENRIYIVRGVLGGIPSGSFATATTITTADVVSQFGDAVASAGDVNGDGYDDVIVGGYGYDSGSGFGEGAAFIFHGGPTGIASGNENSAATRLEGNQAFGYFGRSVASAGDVNGDGYDDVIVGSSNYDSEGAAFVFLGSPTGVANGSPATAHARFEANQEGAQLGESVASAGDVNGDGYADVIVGSIGLHSSEGGALIFHGSAAGMVNGNPATASAQLRSGQPFLGVGLPSNFGKSVASAGDVNGDGYADVLVGAQFYDQGDQDRGAAFVYHGSAAGVPSNNDAATASKVLLGAATPLTYFGGAVASAGDVNGDGYSDVLVGAPSEQVGTSAGAGRSYVHLGSPIGLATSTAATAYGVLESTQASASFGYAVASLGDVNGDGFDDVVATAPSFDSGQVDEGAVFIYHGGGAGVFDFAADVTPPSIESNQASAFLGWSIASAGDVNGDGHGDVIVGAPNYDDGESNEGAAFLFHGSENGISNATPATANAVFTSNQADAFLGRRVASAGDVNGDGYDDVIIGAPAFDSGEVDEGAAFLFLGSATGVASGSPATASTRLEGNQASAVFGWSPASAGDVNGDGYADVLVSATGYDNGSINEGAVFVFHGSAAGIAHGGPATASAILESDQGTNLGGSLSTPGFGIVARAGDVNADGFGDILIGSPGFENGQIDEGSAFLFLGSPTGVGSGNPSTADARFESNQSQAWFGASVAPAGDVNADGYADVIIGAKGFSALNGSPVAYVYHGSASGIANGGPTTANAELAQDAPTASIYGVSVDSAGDVDADGFGDVIIGNHPIFPPIPTLGAAFVHRGSATGIASGNPTTAHARIRQLSVVNDNPTAQTAASAGDFNGDGHGDVVIGASAYGGGQSLEGGAWVRLGNAGGRALRIRQLRADGSNAPVAPGGSSHSSDSIKVELFARSLPDQERAKLEVEVCPLGTAFGAPACLHHVGASFTNLGGSGAVLQETVTGLAEDSVYAWRVRILAIALAAAPPPTGPAPRRGHWYRFQARSEGSDFRTAVPEPGLPGAMAATIAAVSAMGRRRQRHRRAAESALDSSQERDLGTEILDLAVGRCADLDPG